MSENKQRIAILTFRVGNQYYALSIEHVLEVAAMMTLSRVTNAPEALLGIANRHCAALAMLDLSLVFGLDAVKQEVSTLFIIAQSEGTEVGLVVDEVFQVKYLASSAFKAVQSAGKYITHMISDDQKLYQQLNLSVLLEDYLIHIPF